MWEEACMVDSFDGVPVCCIGKQFCVEQKIMLILNKSLFAAK